MSKKVKGFQKWQSLAHPAALAAESDLVKLTREFEELKAQLRANEEEVKEHDEDIRAAHVNHQTTVMHHHTQLGRLRRQRRTLDAMFANVNELLRPLIQTDENACCAVNELRRF